MKSENKYLRGLILFIVLIAVLFGIYIWKKPQTVKGDKEIGITVIDDKGKEVQYFDSTDADYLRTVLDELEEQDFSYSGDEGIYGYYVYKVNGVKADNISAYWAFYVNGKYCSYGVDNQPVNDGDMFEIIYEKVSQDSRS
ncbi:hypothetical protein SDC9_178477 [bioreactor metagenome]|uniref:Transcobalamin-like C-terminal domain-containing protein n=1 Tax=bioreactor metagenome TaxID=1076179 RepID=A0A645GXN0_9ZZZZ|nr:DUF4430 domain-containing protein [Candidatus Metalachnospira sp.]